MSKISAILMAAGLSRRMGVDKLFMQYQGNALIEHALTLLGDLPVFEKIIVTTTGRLEKIILPPDVRAIINHNPEIGQSESLRLGVSGASGDWYLFLNADQPRLQRTSLQPMLELTKSNPGKIIYPTANGQPTSPVLFHSNFRDELLSVRGDIGGRAIRQNKPYDCVVYEAEKPEDFLDIDIVADLNKQKMIVKL
jgi:molybdenum cofactor cytidylyltransferase